MKMKSAIFYCDLLLDINERILRCTQWIKLKKKLFIIITYVCSNNCCA